MTKKEEYLEWHDNQDYYNPMSQDDIDRLQQFCDDFMAQCDNLEKKVNDQARELRELSNTVRDLSNSCDEQSIKIADLEKEISELKDKIRDLENDVGFVYDFGEHHVCPKHRRKALSTKKCVYCELIDIESMLMKKDQAELKKKLEIAE